MRVISFGWKISKWISSQDLLRVWNVKPPKQRVNENELKMMTFLPCFSPSNVCQPPFSYKLALKVALYSSKSHIHGSFCFTLLPPSIFFRFQSKKEQFLPGCHTQGNIQISRPGNIPNLKKVLVICPTKEHAFPLQLVDFPNYFHQLT